MSLHRGEVPGIQSVRLDGIGAEFDGAPETTLTPGPVPPAKSLHPRQAAMCLSECRIKLHGLQGSLLDLPEGLCRRQRTVSEAHLDVCKATYHISLPEA